MNGTVRSNPMKWKVLWSVKTEFQSSKNFSARSRTVSTLPESALIVT